MNRKASGEISQEQKWGWKAISQKAKSMGLDGFLAGILLMVLLAYAAPGFGRSGGPLPLAPITTYGVSLIFFFYGLRLSPEKLQTGVRDWRLHLVVQGTTFALFPILILALQQIVGFSGQDLVWLGIFYVAALPSTVSSSVVMVSIAGGNLPGAIFNASISSLLGVFLTPLWMGYFLQSQTGEFPFLTVLAKLMLQVVLPVLLGVLLHKRFGFLAEQYRQRLKLFDQSIILLIVYVAFCDSFVQGVFSVLSLQDLFLLGLGMTLLFFLVLVLVRLFCRFLAFTPENEITAFFCGSKKSLVHGSVMSKVLFTNPATVGLILLPLMLYHGLQLVYASIIAQSLARKSRVPTEPQN